MPQHRVSHVNARRRLECREERRSASRANERHDQLLEVFVAGVRSVFAVVVPVLDFVGVHVVAVKTLPHGVATPEHVPP